MHRPELNSAAGSAVSDALGSYAGDTLKILAKSKLGLSGLALTLAGFFGVWGVLGLRLQQAILSAYVLLFGLTLIFFSLGWQAENIAKYFGFIYRPHGQLGFLLIAGNLAWSSGWLGVLAALFTNVVAFGAWYTASAEGGASSWPMEAPRSRPGSATGMGDVRDDELL